MEWSVRRWINASLVGRLNKDLAIVLCDPPRTCMMVTTYRKIGVRAIKQQYVQALLTCISNIREWEKRYYEATSNIVIKYGAILDPLY